jgi:D-serine deaminase-like pyridoxal phosphate-dependent protein
MNQAPLSPDSDVFYSLRSPCLILDKERLEYNIESMATKARQAGVTLRPHIKTHKSPHIAALQMRAEPTVGIACATVAEAEAIAAAGIGGLLLTSPLMQAAQWERVAQLNRAQDLIVVVDHPAQIEGLLGALQAGDRTLGIAVDVDVGQARTGITDFGAGVELARMIAERPELKFAGIQGFAGHAQHIIDPGERRAAVENAATTLRAFAKALTEAGLPPTLITGSGTGTHDLDAGNPYNELQVGSYVFMDADYDRLRYEQGQELPFVPSLFVLATVVSVNRPDQVTVDVGTKALATNGPPPAVIVGAPSGSRYQFAGDEHGVIAVPSGERPSEIGARLLIGATHCDPTVNLHASFFVIKDDTVEDWPICGRYGD